MWRVEREGERLEKPPDCPQELYAVMRKCWTCNPNDRPNFTQLGVLVAEVGGGASNRRFDPAMMAPFWPHPLDFLHRRSPRRRRPPETFPNPGNLRWQPTTW